MKETSLRVVKYSEENSEIWDIFCKDAQNSTFLHTRKFLSYHNKKFIDTSLLIFSEDKLVGLFPAAQSLQNLDLIVSHPGITYGGFVHHGWLTGQRILDALGLITFHYKALGYTGLLYKPIPYIYTKVPSQDDLYALFRVGAERTRCDLSSTIDLLNRKQPSERRRRGLKKAVKQVKLTNDMSFLSEVYNVLANNLKRRHETLPVHSIEDLSLLVERFPENIYICAALIGGVVEAGVILFTSENIWHAQYIASSEVGYEISALDAIFEELILCAKSKGVRYFDFGICNEDGGKILNEGLYRFKTEFGGGGVVHEFYEFIM